MEENKAEEEDSDWLWDRGFNFNWVVSKAPLRQWLLSKDLKGVRQNSVKSWTKFIINHKSQTAFVFLYPGFHLQLCECLHWLPQRMGWGKPEEETLLLVISWRNQGSSMLCNAQDSHRQWRWVQKKCQDFLVEKCWAWRASAKALRLE